jgi:hypothetical protein
VLNRLESRSIYLSLLADDSVFTQKERVQTLREMYPIVGTGAGPFFPDLMRPDPLYVITQWNEDATLAFRDPWFDYLGRLYNLREWEYSRSDSGLLHFAPQAFGILLLKYVSDSSGLALSLAVDRAIPTGLIGGNPIPSGNTLALVLGKLGSNQGISSNLMSQYSILSASIPTYKQWVSNNAELVGVWSDPSFHVLRHCSDTVMRRILRRGWVEMSDLRGAPE